MSTPKNLPPGATSLDLSQIKSVQQLAQLLTPYFLSSSLGTAPLAQGGTGNRTVVLTSKSDYVQSLNGQTGAVTTPPTDGKQAALVAGSYVWTFAAQFANPPLVFAFPVGAPPSAGTTLYLAADPTTTAVTIMSTDATDARTIELFAFENPT